jgi:glycosyltransferase involved in cell wall biosynthesis
MSAQHETALTIVTCSIRPANLQQNLCSLTRIRGQADYQVFILNLEEDQVDEGFTESVRQAGVEVFFTGSNHGLSYSRNLALDYCRTQYLLFVDDDVLVSYEAVEMIRATLAAGADIVGVLISGPRSGMKRRWFFSEGQWHYLCVHNNKGDLRTWGACMAFNAKLARDRNIRFRLDLGMNGQRFIVGGDTTFVRDFKQVGGIEVFLDYISVYHEVAPERFTFRYLLRRAFACGRTEVRRRNFCGGISKEWSRYLAGNRRSFHRWVLAFLYTSVVVSGAIYESIHNWSLLSWPYGKRANQ